MIQNKIDLFEYALRKLGFPVININVDDDQIEDRLQDTIDLYIDYHYDGSTPVYHDIEVTDIDLLNNYFTIPKNITHISRIMTKNLGGSNSGIGINLGDGVLANLPTFSDYGSNSSTQFQDPSTNLSLGNDGMSLGDYVTKMQSLSLMRSVLSVRNMPIRFNNNTHKLNIDSDWSKLFNVGDHIVVSGFENVDPLIYTDIYNDRWIKKYFTALLKKQWGQNLSKYEGIQMVGNVVLNGDKIYDQAIQEIDKLEEEIQAKYEIPAIGFMF